MVSPRLYTPRGDESTNDRSPTCLGAVDTARLSVLFDDEPPPHPTIIDVVIRQTAVAINRL